MFAHKHVNGEAASAQKWTMGLRSHQNTWYCNTSSTYSVIGDIIISWSLHLSQYLDRICHVIGLQAGLAVTLVAAVETCVSTPAAED